MPETTHTLPICVIALMLPLVAAAAADDVGAPIQHATEHGTKPAADVLRSEARLDEKLAQPTSIYSIESPLVDVLQALADKHDVPIIVDQPWLKEHRADLRSPITLDARGLRLRDALDLMLPRLGMSYVTRDGSIWITSLEQARAHQYVRAYQLPPFTKGKEERLVKGLIKTISPELWKPNGGSYSATAAGGLLTIDANRRLHTATIMTLEKIRRMHDTSTSNQPRFRGPLTADSADPFAPE